MRLINAEDIPYTMLYKENWMKGTGEEAQGAWKSDIDKLPTIDAVQVVRCKDCVYFSKSSEEYWIENDCDFHEWYRAEPKEDDYCSRGKRKNNE